MSVAQPDFLDAFVCGAKAAADAYCADGAGNETHTAVTSWKAFTKTLFLPCLRPLDPVTTPLSTKLEEVDLVRAYAWWRVTQCGTSPPTVRQYVGIINAWHERVTGVYLAASMPFHSVFTMLQGLEVLEGRPPPKKDRVGCRPRDLRVGIDRLYSPAIPLHVNYATSMEIGHAGILRACEYVRGKRKVFDPSRGSASRADVTFELDASGEAIGCCFHAVNLKAKGVERFRKLPHYLPMDGGYLSPGRMLLYLTEIVDWVPKSERSSTPMFRDPASNEQLHIDGLRTELRKVMQAAGRPPRKVGTHSLRIGGATARKFVGGSRRHLMAAGKWSSAAYLAYLRQCKAESLSLVQAACGADVDDFANEFFDIEYDPEMRAFAGSDDEE